MTLSSNENLFETTIKIRGWIRHHTISIFWGIDGNIVKIRDNKSNEDWSREMVDKAFDNDMLNGDAKLWFAALKDKRRMINPLERPTLKASYQKILEHLVLTFDGPKDKPGTMVTIKLVGGKQRFIVVYRGRVVGKPVTHQSLAIA